MIAFKALILICSIAGGECREVGETGFGTDLHCTASLPIEAVKALEDHPGFTIARMRCVRT